MNCQKELFQLDEDLHYINCAYMSPLLRSVEEAGIKGMMRKRNPASITPSDFFRDAEEVRALFAALIHAPASHIALIPSVSYGMGIITRNVQFSKGQKILTVHEEFPSDIYALHRICEEQGTEIVTVHPPDRLEGRGRTWNERILEAITPGTAMVNLSSVHWADGTLFNLEAISKRAREVGALFVVDGTQSVGALDFDIRKYDVDALFCSGYKWLLGPYTSGFAYLNERFHQGKPIEETWLNRLGSEDFRALVSYQPRYSEGAGRFNMGEFSNFINLPMMRAALQQILQWGTVNIQQYCRELMQPLLNAVQQKGFWVEEEGQRAEHLLGLRLPAGTSIEELQKQLIQRKVVVSLRGSALRLSPHLYNEQKDIDVLAEALGV